MERDALEELLARACRREPAALAELVERYSRRVFGLVYRLTGSRDAAEDLMQETFLRVVRGIEQYEHVGRFEAWLFRIAANLARDRARKGVRRGEMASLDGLEMDKDLPVSNGDMHEDPAGRVALSEDRAALAVGLERLGDVDREILLLRHYGELSFKEIAEVLKIPLGTALARAHRALQRLREHLTREE